MLYPKNQAPFDPQEFKNPGKEYRATPFWAFNSELNLPELTWQIEQLKKMGYGGVHMHVRTGMATPYLSDEYMALIKGCVDKAKKEDMLAWLYDEDRWPSGAAGGIVTKNPAYRQRYLKFSRSDKEPGELLAAYDVELNPDGSLKVYRRVKAGETPRGFTLYAIHQIAGTTRGITIRPISIPWIRKALSSSLLSRMSGIGRAWERNSARPSRRFLPTSRSLPARERWIMRIRPWM